MLRPRRRQPPTEQILGDKTPRRRWWEVSICYWDMADALAGSSSHNSGYVVMAQGLGVALPFFFFFFFFFFLFFRDRVSLCSPGCPGAHFVDQAGLELRNPPASAS